jgi:hypothetical protein
MRSKTLRSSIAPILVLLIFAAACAGMTPQRVALNTLQSVRTSVVAAVNVFGDGYKAGQFNDVQRDALKVVYNKYLAADTAAALSLKVATDVQAQAITTDVVAASVAVLQFVQSLKPQVIPTPAAAPASTR